MFGAEQSIAESPHKRGHYEEQVIVPEPFYYRGCNYVSQLRLYPVI